MASLIVRNLDDSVKTLLRVQAAYHGQSMEEEARQILRKALVPESTHTPEPARLIQTKRLPEPERLEPPVPEREALAPPEPVAEIASRPEPRFEPKSENVADTLRRRLASLAGVDV